MLARPTCTTDEGSACPPVNDGVAASSGRPARDSCRAEEGSDEEGAAAFKEAVDVPVFVGGWNCVVNTFCTGGGVSGVARAAAAIFMAPGTNAGLAVDPTGRVGGDGVLPLCGGAKVGGSTVDAVRGTSIQPPGTAIG